MEKKYSGLAVLQKKVENLDSQITPIISQSRESNPTPYDFVPEVINNEFCFINKLINAEKNSTSNLCHEDINIHKHDLDQIVHRVQTMQSVLREWTKPRPTSSFTVSSKPPVCSNADSCIYEEDDLEEVHKLDHESEEGFPLVGFKVYQNSEFVADDDQDRLMEFEGLNEEIVGEQEGEELVSIDDYTENRVVNAEKCISDEQDEVGKFETIKDEVEIIRVIDRKDDNREKAEKDYDDEEDYVTSNTHCCFRFLFWGGLIGIGIISLMAGFPDFPDYHSPALSFTPT